MDQCLFSRNVPDLFRNFPLSEMHPDAEAAAEVAEFAGAQGKFWEMHDKLYENQERLGEALYLDLAEKLKLSTTALRRALEERTFEARVRADFKGGVRSGANGTPTFFINGHRHDGPSTLKRWFQRFTRPWERRKAPRGRRKPARPSGSPNGSSAI